MKYLNKIKQSLSFKWIVILAVALMNFGLISVLVIAPAGGFAMWFLRFLLVALILLIHFVFYEVVYFEGQSSGKTMDWLKKKLIEAPKTKSIYTEGKLDAYAEVAEKLNSYNITDTIELKITPKPD